MIGVKVTAWVIGVERVSDRSERVRGRSERVRLREMFRDERERERERYYFNQPAD